MRDFLVYIPTRRGAFAADLSGTRNFDVVLNDYSGDGFSPTVYQVERWFTHRGHKWPVICRLADLCLPYEAVCFLDDDVEIDCDRLNRLFAAGLALRLNLWQAALTRDSYRSHGHLVQVPGSYVRRVPMVEIMMPVFSRAALAVCRPTFAESQSGYGLDYVWPKLLDNQGLAVVDAISARHARPIHSDRWLLPNGKTPKQEHRELEAKYQLAAWDYHR